MSAVIHHLVRRDDWHRGEDPYRPPSLEHEGYIHFSTTEQVPVTSQRYYAGTEVLLLVTVAVEAVAENLRWENLAGTGTFPHLYAPLRRDAVVDVRPYRPGDPVTGPA